jgi:hypothetical protein
MAGILLASFTFVPTEVLYSVSLLGGLGIAMKETVVGTAKAGKTYPP